MQSLVHKLSGSKVEISMRKKVGEEWWPRLLSEKSKPCWLKTDFDKWEDPDAESSEDELSPEAMEVRNNVPSFLFYLPVSSLLYLEKDG